MSRVRLNAEQRKLRRQRTREWKKNQPKNRYLFFISFLIANELYNHRKEK